MFLVTPGGGRAVAWVAAAGCGFDDPALSVTPRARRAAADGHGRDPLGGIEAHGEAPPQLARRRGRYLALYAVGREMPGGRFPGSALRFIRAVDAGRT